MKPFLGTYFKCDQLNVFSFSLSVCVFNSQSDIACVTDAWIWNVEWYVLLSCLNHLESDCIYKIFILKISILSINSFKSRMLLFLSPLFANQYIQRVRKNIHMIRWTFRFCRNLLMTWASRLTSFQMTEAKIQRICIFTKEN